MSLGVNERGACRFAEVRVAVEGQPVLEARVNLLSRQVVELRVDDGAAAEALVVAAVLSEAVATALDRPVVRDEVEGGGL